MKRLLFGLVLISAVTACGGGDSTAPAGPSGTNIQGTFIGSYTAKGEVFQGVLQLTQSGNSVAGTLTSSAGRSARVSGSISGTRLSATFTFTDGCAGTASSTADITAAATTLVGNYAATDCVGQYSGGYSLLKQ